MNKDELIVKQSLKIEELQQELCDCLDSVNDIYRSLFCIGAPLNDNCINLNKEQIKYFMLYVGNPITSLYESLWKYKELL